jgi:hypothetical protein
VQGLELLRCSFYDVLNILRSYGTAKSGVGISAMGVLRPDLMMKCVVPVIMAGIIGVCFYSPSPYLPSVLNNVQIYGLVVSVLISSSRAFCSFPAHHSGC